MEGSIVIGWKKFKDGVSGILIWLGFRMRRRSLRRRLRGSG